MKYPDIDPVLIHIGPLQIRWYGLMYVIGFLLAYYILLKTSSRRGHDLTRQDIGDFLLYVIVGVVVGARLGYCIIYDLSYYFHSPLQVLALWEGGMSFHGGALGVLIAGWIYALRKNKPFLMLADLGALATPLGLFFGRIGNFINGELYGRPTKVPWGIVFPGAGEHPRHPSQLYEAFFEGVMLFAILLWLSKRRVPQGFLLGTFLFGYGVFRFFLEFFREPDPQLGFIAGPFTMGQLLCSIMVGFGGYLCWLSLRLENRKDGEA